MSVSGTINPRKIPELRAVLELIKPITWFPPMWAYVCGVISSGVSPTHDWYIVLLGIVLAGPIVCGMSQAANDWCDRNVDAINEPNRPIPSGRVPAHWGLGIAVAMSILSLVVGWQLGPWGFGATILAVTAAWMYSAEPIRLKRSGWWGPGIVGLSYESLPWFTGAAVLSAGAPTLPVVTVALLYGIGAHGIMTLNDFKALEGDRQMNVNSLPVVHGPKAAARMACLIMTLPQLGVVGLLVHWQQSYYAMSLGILILLQFIAMSIMLKDPRAKAPWYNSTGVLFYVFGMMIAAFALRNVPTIGS